MLRVRKAMAARAIQGSATGTSSVRVDVVPEEKALPASFFGFRSQGSQQSKIGAGTKGWNLKSVLHELSPFLSHLYMWQSCIVRGMVVSCQSINFNHFLHQK
jgi:hypothetical protein